MTTEDLVEKYRKDQKEREWRFKEAVGSMDRYGLPNDGIINILEALSDYIDDEAHGRGGYDEEFRIIQEELDSLRAKHQPGD